MVRSEVMRELVKAIERDNTYDLEHIYRYSDARISTEIYCDDNKIRNQLEYAVGHKAESCIYFLLNHHNFEVTKNIINRALGKMMEPKVISFLVENAHNRYKMQRFVIGYYYRNKKYFSLLEITGLFGISYDYFELKVLGYQNYADELIELGAKYDKYDLVHFFLANTFDSDLLKEYIPKTGICNFKNEKGNIIHITFSVYEKYKKYYTDEDFGYCIMNFFGFGDIDPFEKGYDGLPCICHLKYYDTEIYQKYLDSGKYSAFDFIYPRIFLNGDLDVLFEAGLPKDTKFNGMLLFDYALQQNKFNSVASLYNKVPGSRPFYNGKHIIELAYIKKDARAIAEMFGKGLGYNPEEYYKIKGFNLMDAYGFCNLVVFFPDPKNFGLVIQDFIKNFKPEYHERAQVEFKNMAENNFSLAEDDEKFKFLEIYFQNSQISNTLSLGYLIKHGASVKYGRPLHFLVENKKRFKEYEKYLKIIIKRGLIDEKVDMDCKLLSDMYDHLMDGSFDPNLFIKIFKELNSEIKNFSIKAYDDKIKFLNIWNRHKKIKTIENFKFLKSVGASGYNILNLKILFNFGGLYRSVLLEEILESFVEHGKKLPKLANNENYLLLAATSKSMFCKTPNVIRTLIQLGVDTTQVEDQLIFQFIDQFVLSPEIYQTLIDNGVNIDVKTKKGETPLIYLLKNWGVCDQRYDIAELFINAGISKTAKDIKGYTALSVAKIEKDSKMVNLLK